MENGSGIDANRLIFRQQRNFPINPVLILWNANKGTADGCAFLKRKYDRVSDSPSEVDTLFLSINLRSLYRYQFYEYIARYSFKVKDKRLLKN